MNLAEKLRDLSDKAKCKVEENNIKTINELTEDFYKIVLERIYAEANNGNKFLNFSGKDFWPQSELDKTSLPKIKFVNIIRHKHHKDAWLLVKEVLIAIAKKLHYQELKAHIETEGDGYVLRICWYKEKEKEKEQAYLVPPAQTGNQFTIIVISAIFIISIAAAIFGLALMLTH